MKIHGQIGKAEKRKMLKRESIGKAEKRKMLKRESIIISNIYY